MLKISEQKKKKLPYFSDVLLFKRVDKYLDDNIDKQMIDKDAMVDELRETYKEYQRRNRSAFRVAVFKAYNMINQNILEVTQERSNDGSDVEAVDEQASQVNSSHQMDRTTPGSVANMLQTYLQGINSMASPAGSRQSKNPNNELINISSDEEGDEEPPAKRPSIIQSRDVSSNPRRVHHQQQMFRSMQKPHPSEANVHHVAQGLRMFNAVLPDVNTPSPHNQQPRRDEDPRRKKTTKINYPALSIFPAEKRNRNHLPDTVPEITFADFGGYPKVLQAVSDLVLHFYQSDVYSMLGVTPPRGFLLHGPPGCGKTLLAHAIAGELNWPLVKASGPELIGGISGESEERIRKMFQQAKQQVPCILFIDEIDVISQTRENARKDMERRIVSQLIVSLDELNTCDEGEELIVIGATNSVEELDPGLRRAGRFDKEVCIGIPDRNAREGILRVLCRFLKMSSEISIEKIAELTPGFVAADLKSLISDAAVVAVKRVFDGRSSKARESRNSQPTIVNEEPINIVDDDKSESMAVDNVTNKTESEDTSKNADKAVKVADEVKIDDGFDEADNDKTEDAVKDETKLDGVNDSEKAKSGEVIENEALNEEGERLVNGCGSPNEDTKDDVAEKNEGGGSETVESPKTAKKSSLEESTVMDVDDTSTSNDLAIVPAVNEVVENGVGEEDQKSEDMDACVIIEEAVKTVNASVENTPLFKSNIAQSGYQDKSISIQIEMSDLLAALKTTQPSSKREGFATVPDVTWDDIGSLKDVRNELTMSIMMPVKYPDEFSRMGIDAPSGIMLWGPPGCGKTLLAKAIANEANINFISVKGPELLNMYVGESEKAVRTCFARARNSQPCVIFFDEIDALCPRRSDSSEGSVSSRVVNQVLTEMDGVEGRHGVFLMAASNRPDMVDPAVLRPGRLDKIVKVGLPNAHDRIDILKAITKNGTKPPLDKSVSLDDIGSSSLCDGYSGADLAALVKEASILALTEYLNKRESSSADQESIEKLYVNERHFIDATKKIKPSVHAEERNRYERLEKSFAAASAP